MDITLRCCVIDDEPLARDLICSFIKKTPFLELENSYSTASEAVRSVIEGKVDLVFLDIQMPELNGMEFARIIPENCRVIFVTAYEQYALEGFRHNALDYLLKPVSYNEFFAAANKALQWKQMKTYAEANMQLYNEKKNILVKSEYKLIQIPLDKITYIEGLKDYVKIYTETSPNCIMSLIKMRTVENYLPSNQFLRVHRSFIVNMDKITMIERNRIVFGKTYIPISETYKESFSSYIKRHLVSERVESVLDE